MPLVNAIMGQNLSHVNGIAYDVIVSKSAPRLENNMGTITGRQIKGFVRNGKLGIEPFDESLIQGATYDLRLGRKILASPLSPDILGVVVELTKEKPSYDIQSGQMVGVISAERLLIPLDMSGRFGIRSSMARKGINAFGGLQLDPGFRGRLTMNLLNVGPEPVTLTYREPIFSVEFSRLEEEADPYAGPYQDQDDFPADQINYVLKARSTSLAEIPSFRQDIRRLNILIEELQEKIPDPDQGLTLRPEVEEKLKESALTPSGSLISAQEMRRRLGI
jgi:dCTP deaminase